MKLYKSIYLLFLVLISACKNEINLTSQSYLDVQKLVEEQIQKGEKENWELNKFIQLNGEESDTLVKNPDWNNEWDMFKAVDLNKAAFQNSYIIDSTENKISYIGKKGEELEIEKMEITLDSNQNLSSISIQAHNKNILFETQRTLKMDFKNESVENYEIRGFQKIVLLDSTIYQVRGEVIPQTNR